MYVDKFDEVGKYKKPMYIIDSDRLDGNYDKVFGCKALSRQMEEIEIGTIIEIKYYGKIDGKENTYHKYQVNRLQKPEIQ